MQRKTIKYSDIWLKGSAPLLHSNIKDEVGVSVSPPVSEFVSDSFDSCKINEDDLRKEMQQLVLDKKEHPNAQQGESQGGGWWYFQSSASDSTLGFVFFFSEETADWERELQEELQMYECQDHDNQDENWDREIEEMLKEES